MPTYDVTPPPLCVFILDRFPEIEAGHEAERGAIVPGDMHDAERVDQLPVVGVAGSRTPKWGVKEDVRYPQIEV
jgi:hypothetical protein